MLPSFFLYVTMVQADTVVLKTGKELKGVVVEKHADRIILSTEKGEIPILLKGIQELRYDDAAQNFLKAGRDFEAEKKFGEALAYYEKALELNPDLEEARKAAVGVRNRFWASTTEGPVGEIEKQQVLYDAWGQGKPFDQIVRAETIQQTRALKEKLGITLKKKEDWVALEFVSPSGAAAQAGLKKNDRLLSIDGESLRYLSVDVVRQKMLKPRFTSFTLEFERDLFLHKGESRRAGLKELGFELGWEYEGLKVKKVKAGTPAEAAEIKEDDFVEKVDEASTRYMPLKEVLKLIEQSEEERLILAIRRPALLKRQ